MNSTDNSIIEGSTRKRALKLINHYVQLDHKGTGLFTDEEAQTLLRSFNSDKEIEQYNKYKKMFENIKIALSNISTYKYSYSDALQRLDKLLLLKHANVEYHFLAARLGLLIEDASVKEKVLELFKPQSNRIFVNTENFDMAMNNLNQTITGFKSKVLSELVQLKTAIQVYKDYVKETKFNVAIISRMIMDIEAFARLGKGTYIIINRNDLHKLMLSNTHIEELEKIGLIEDYDKPSIDLEKYRSLRKVFFNEQ